MGREELRALTEKTLVPVGLVVGAIMLTITVVGWAYSGRGEASSQIAGLRLEMQNNDSQLRTQLEVLRSEGAKRQSEIDSLKANADELKKDIYSQLKTIGDTVTDIRIQLGRRPAN